MGTFWDNSNTETRIEQVQSGADLGMTAKQVAMCLRVENPNIITVFASRHGISFSTGVEKRSRAAKKAWRGPPRFEQLTDEDIHPFSNSRSKM